MTPLHELIDLELMLSHLDFVLAGLGVTLSIALISFIFSLILGTAIALIRILNIPIIKYIANAYVSFFRGVPALVVLFFIYFGLPFAGITLDAYTSSIIGFTLTSSAYTSEVVRSSIIAVNREQWEMAMDLGANIPQIIRYIILPQATRIAIPALSNILLDLIKGTSLTAMITVRDIFQRAKIVAATNNNYITMYLLLAIIYWLICWIFEQGQHQLEAYYNINHSTISH